MRLGNSVLHRLPSMIPCQFIHHARWTASSSSNFTFAIQQIGDIMQSTNVIGSSFMVGRTSLIHLSPLRHTLSNHPMRPMIMLNAKTFYSFGNGSILHILIHTSMVHLSLPPFAAAKCVIVSLKMTGMPFGNTLLCFKTPYPLSMFLRIQFMLIKEPT